MISDLIIIKVSSLSLGVVLSQTWHIQIIPDSLFYVRIHYLNSKMLCCPTMIYIYYLDTQIIQLIIKSRLAVAANHNGQLIFAIDICN